MLVRLSPEISQIRWHVNAVLADFETLNHDQETMIAAAKGELQLLLDYLIAIEATNQEGAVVRSSDGYIGLNIKSSFCNNKTFNEP